MIIIDLVEWHLTSDQVPKSDSGLLVLKINNIVIVSSFECNWLVLSWNNLGLEAVVAQMIKGSENQYYFLWTMHCLFSDKIKKMIKLETAEFVTCFIYPQFANN